MKHNVVIALVMIAVVGLAAAFLGGSFSPRGTIANEVSETTGDAYLCGSTSTFVDDPYVDMDKVNIRQVKGGWEVTVSMGPSMQTIFADSFSAAVEVRLGIYTGLYQVHNGELLINNATLTTEFLIFFFAVLLPLEIDLKVDSFHQSEDGDPVNCDTAFLEDATSGKITPTATDGATITPPTPTGTTESITATPTPSATPGTPKDTPAPTVTPEEEKVFVSKLNDDGGLALPDWEMRIFDGDGCIGSPRASGFTAMSINRIGYSLFLPLGDYSIAETQQPGWERIFPEGTFCQNFTVTPGIGAIPIFLSFTNRRIRNGDVNEDGVTNSLDTLLVLQFIAGLIPELPSVRGDVNEDGVVNAVDTALMLQFEAGLLDSLPVGDD